MFRRRNKRSWLQLLADSLYPRGGWGRAASYVLHRLRRLPDPPHKIARGIFAGVLITFTPLYGLHIVFGALIALAIRGNVLASMLATFFGNPVTYVPIAIVSLQTGHFMLGTKFDTAVDRSMLGKFSDATGDFFKNTYFAATGQPTDWQSLYPFYNEFFLPFMVGGIIPGLVAALGAYYISTPIIAAYQKRRFSRLRERAEKRLAKRAAQAKLKEANNGK